MKLTNEQFTEAAFIFEKVNGATHSDFEIGIISKSELKKYEPVELEQIIVDGLNSGIYKNEDERVSGYWALSKTGSRSLIPHYQKWLKNELKNGKALAIFQILIALDKFDEPVFHKNRPGRGVDETDLNMRDAKNYLKNLNNAI